MVQVRRVMRFLRKLKDPANLEIAERAVFHREDAVAATCPICGFHGPFEGGGTLLRFNVLCPGCGSAERHRLLALALQRDFVSFGGCDVLHFAPEEAVTKLIRAQEPKSYLTGDILPGRAERELNIEALDLPDAAFDRVLCSHVLEHVDDARALGELRRVLRPGGRAVLMVPLVEGWPQTYEDAEVKTDRLRDRHFGQYDHIRLYGADFRKRVTDAGFSLGEFGLGGAECVRYNLVPGERVFLATK